MPSAQTTSVFQQLPTMIARHSRETWAAALEGEAPESPEERELSVLLLAANLELLGYTPEHARMFAEREVSKQSGRTDG